MCEDYDNRGLHKLSKLCANEKFSHDLTETVKLAKEDNDGSYVLYYHNKKSFETKSADEIIKISLKGTTSEIITVMPIENGFCAIGLCDKYNIGAAVTDIIKTELMNIVRLSGGGIFSFYSEKAPEKILCENKLIEFSKKSDNIYEAKIEADTETDIHIYF